MINAVLEKIEFFVRINQSMIYHAFFGPFKRFFDMIDIQPRGKTELRYDSLFMEV